MINLQVLIILIYYKQTNKQINKQTNKQTEFPLEIDFYTRVLI